MREFRARLLGLLADRGMTQIELCRRSGVARSTLGNYAAGRVQPTLRQLRLIREALGCTWEELLGE